MAFPVTRLRRLRRTAELRNLVCETRLSVCVRVPDVRVSGRRRAQGRALDAGRVQFVGGSSAALEASPLPSGTSDSSASANPPRDGRPSARIEVTPWT